jgi:maltose O-acetyltransferase
MSNSAGRLLRRVGAVVLQELKGFSPGVVELRWIDFLLSWASPRFRANALRLLGVHAGPGARINTGYIMTGPRGAKNNLILGANSELGRGVVIDLTDRVEIGDHVKIGARAMILTSSHELGPREHRAGPVQTAPVSIGEGAEIGPGAILLPGITIGARAVIEENSVVVKDVPPEARMRGNPAAVVKVVSSEGEV